MVSVIIPTYNESDNIKQIEAVLDEFKGDFEVIFTDGFSTDDTFEKINYPKIQETTTRAAQMNAAVKYAKGDYLFFLHCDSLIGPDAIREIVESGLDAGCFSIKFYPPNLKLKWVEFSSNLRVRMNHIAFGDQGIFIKKEVFEKLGGYRPIPLMEDLALSEDLKDNGIKLKQLDYPIFSSARRLEGLVFSKGLFMKLLQKAYRSGYPVEKIAQIYKKL